ncbi:hypothetical protein KP509_20G073500 [Ceratopteris richardii]|nr:hypothetical protein KP509_20G073500 [Ceratopteris richardii]
MVTMRREWAGIDRLRLDKFYLLLRKCLAHMLYALQKSGWHAISTKEFMHILVENAFLAKDPYPALGINLHYADIFFEELKNFVPLTVETFKLLLQPFLDICSQTSEKSLLQRIKVSVFDHLCNIGCDVITSEKDGYPMESASKMLGALFLSMPLGQVAFGLASSSSTSQANRKVLYEIHRAYEKAEKLLNASGVDVSSFTNMPGREMKTIKSFGPVHPIEKSKKKKSKLAKHSDNTKRFDGGKAEDTLALDHMDGDNTRSDRRKTRRCTVDSASEIKDLSSSRKKLKKESSAKQDATAGSSKDGLDTDPDGLGADSSVVLKLEGAFDLLVDDKAMELDSNLSSSLSKSEASNVLSNKNARKKKRKATADASVMPAEEPDAGESHPTSAVKAGSSAGKVKRVRFALKKNLVWTPSTPLPAENIRMPPSATPRGSALKKGVPPGPIIAEGVKRMKQRRGTPMRPVSHGKIFKSDSLKDIKLLLDPKVQEVLKKEYGKYSKVITMWT